ncbi:MAG: hypothetical protein U0325_35505 [Polyangiales bacterium]
MSTPDDLRAFVRDTLPSDWRNELQVTARGDQILIRLRDDAGLAHTLDLRPAEPGAPTLVPGELLRFAYTAAADEVIDDARLARYRAVLTSLAAHERTLVTWMRDTPTPASGAAPGPAPVDHRGPEWIAFEAGLKPAIRVVLAAPDEIADLAATVRSRGWGFYASPDPVRFSSYTQRIGYVARTDDDARALADLEAPEGDDGVRFAAGDAAQNERLGVGLGYPACCTAAFARRIALGVSRCPDDTLAHEDYAAAAWALADTTAPHWTLNNLLPDPDPPRLVTWFPCRYDCEATRRYAEALFAILEARSPTMAAAWRAALQQRTGVDRDGGRTTHPTDDATVLWVDFGG